MTKEGWGVSVSMFGLRDDKILEELAFGIHLQASKWAPCHTHSPSSYHPQKIGTLYGGVARLGVVGSWFPGNIPALGRNVRASWQTRGGGMS